MAKKAIQQTTHIGELPAYLQQSEQEQLFGAGLLGETKTKQICADAHGTKPHLVE